MTTTPAPTATRYASVPAVVDDVAARTPDALAVSFPSGRSTYAELAESSLLSARRLHAAGVRAGDRVGVLLTHVREEYVSMCLGTLRLGAISVPVNARYKAFELRYLSEHSGPKLLYTTPDFVPLLESAGIPETCRVVVIGEDSEFVAGGDAVTADEVRELERQVDLDGPARLIYTSGTTANPKACLHTQRALLAQGEALAERLELTPDDVFWTPLPMFHVAGWATMLGAQARGACFSHVGLFNADASIEQLERDRCTVIFPSFETIWLPVLEHPRFKEADLGAARLVVNVGVPERLKMMEEMFPQAPQVSITGSTEACGFLSVGDPNDPLEVRVRTGGTPLAGMEAKIVDPETKEDLPPDTPGELFFRGAFRFKEYYNDPEVTDATIDADGWFHSGDLMVMDAEGRLAFVSRIKDMLKVGGENVAAAEIEGFLLTHPAVHMCQVVAAPDARYGEVAAAFVELRPGQQVTEEELIAYGIDQISTFKIPRYVRFVEPDQWPMSGTKVKKYVLREQIAEELKAKGIREAPRIKPPRR